MYPHGSTGRPCEDILVRTPAMVRGVPTTPVCRIPGECQPPPYTMTACLPTCPATRRDASQPRPSNGGTPRSGRAAVCAVLATAPRPAYRFVPAQACSYLVATIIPQSTTTRKDRSPTRALCCPRKAPATDTSHDSGVGKQRPTHPVHRFASNCSGKRRTARRWRDHRRCLMKEEPPADWKPAGGVLRACGQSRKKCP